MRSASTDDDWEQDLSIANRVKELIDNNEELLNKFKRLDEDGGAEERKTQLWNILASIADFPQKLEQRDAGYQLEAMREAASDYLRSTEIHNSWVTRRLLKNILDCEISFLDQEAKSHELPLVATSLLSAPWGIIIPQIFSYVFVIASLIAIYAIFQLGFDFLGWAGLVYLVWHCSIRFYYRFIIAKKRGELACLTRQLSCIRHEISTGTFDSETLIGRLSAFENAAWKVTPGAIYISSLIYPLLRCNGARQAEG